MERRSFGRTGLSVSVLGFGGAEIGFGDARPATVERLLGSALDAGLNVIDTAECYATSEELIGRAAAQRRGEYHLFTKVGHSAGLPHPDWDPRLVAPSVERSLKRLRTDHVDVVFLHSCDEDVLGRGEVVAALKRLRDDGKVRFLGYSGDRWPARMAVASGAFDVLQVSLSIADQEAIATLLPEATARGLGVVVKRPLANVAWRWDRRPPDPYHHAYWERLGALDYPFLRGDLPDAVRAALGFVLSTPGVHTALVGTASPNRTRENLELLSQSSPRKELWDEIRERWEAVAPPSWTGQE